MSLPDATRALLLLCIRLDGCDRIPLDATELARLSAWLRKASLSTADLLDPALSERLFWAPALPVPADRLLGLLRRDDALQRSLSAWDADGTRVVAQDDALYPKRLKRRLKAAAPALLLVQGEAIDGLGRGGVALVCGDHPAAEAVGFASRFGATLAGSGLTLLAAGRNAPERAALSACLEAGGTALSSDHPQAAPGGRLLRLRSAGSAGEAAAGWLSALGDAVLLVAVGRGDAGWATAIAGIEQDAQPYWVRPQDAEAGTLIRLGARAITDDAVPRALLRSPTAAQSARTATAAPPALRPHPVPSDAQPGFAEAPTPFAGPSAASGRRPVLSVVPSVPAARVDPALPTLPGLFDLFAQSLDRLLRHGPLGAGRIAEAMQLTRPQAEAWLHRAEAEGRVTLNQKTRLYGRDCG